MTKDIEREAFEALQNQKIFKWFEFDSSVNAYVLKDISASLEKLTALAELNYGWDMWQAAKAQAVPEGFVLVPMVPSERMINAVRQCYEGEAYLPYSLYSEFVNQAIIERMEAQEPVND